MNAQQVFRTTLVVLSTLVLVYFVYLVGELLLALFIAIIFASTIRPAVDKLAGRRVPRGIAATLVTLGIVGVILGLLVVVTPPLIGMTVELFQGDVIMEEIRRLSSWLTFFGWANFRIVLPTITLPAQVAGLLDEAGDTAREIAWPVAQGTIFLLGQIVLMLVMAVYWLTSREQALALLLRLSPARQRSLVGEVWNGVEASLGAYTRGQLILMVSVGAACFMGFLVLRLPYAPALAVVAGLTEAIPMVGPLIGAIPAVLLGFTVSWQTALLVAGWYVVVQQLETHLLAPRVMRRTVGLNPILVIIALIAGATLKGVRGALVAVPVAGALQVIVQHTLLAPAIKRRAAASETGVLVAGAEEVASPVVADPG